MSLDSVAGSTKTVSGQLVGTSEWQPALFRANTWTVHGTYTSNALGSGTYTGTLTTSHEVLDATVESPPGCFETVFVPCSSPRFAVSGSITFTSHGATITGTVEPGSWVTEFDSVHVIGYDFGLTLDLSDGTRRFKHISGSLSLSYSTSICMGFCGPDNGVILDSGTLSGSVSHS